MSKSLEPRDRLAFALDFPTLDDARKHAAPVATEVGVLKVGLELFVSEGPRAAKLASEFGCQLFLDLKLCDIPETVERAVASAASHGVRYLTLHAMGGPRMLNAAARRAQQENPELTLLAITVLTSLDASDLTSIGVSRSPAEQALALAKLAHAEGIGGMVCSAHEVGSLRRALGQDVVLVTPGIRPTAGAADDQKRVGTPRGAIQDGATLLVVGRPIRDAAEPRVAARAIVTEIAEAASAQTLG